MLNFVARAPYAFGVFCAATVMSASAAQDEKIPNFSPDSTTGESDIHSVMGELAMAMAPAFITAVS